MMRSLIIVILCCLVLAGSASVYANPPCGYQGTVVLDGDLTCNPGGSGAAIVLGAGQTLECNYHVIRSMNIYGSAVLVTGPGAAINHCDTSRYSAGIQVQSGGSVQVTDSRVFTAQAVGINLQPGSFLQGVEVGGTVNGNGVQANTPGSYTLDGVNLHDNKGFNLIQGANSTVTVNSNYAASSFSNGGGGFGWDYYSNGGTGQWNGVCALSINLVNSAHLTSTSPGCSPVKKYISSNSTYVEN